MNHLEFDQEMRVMFTEFPQKDFTVGRLELIWNYVNDLRAVQLRKINQHFIATTRSSPAPAAYKEAASKERASSPQRASVTPPYAPDCKACLDVGVVVLSQGEAARFGICDAITPKGKCPQGAWQSWRLPKASEVPGFVSSAIPWEMLNPAIKEASAPQTKPEERLIDRRILGLIEEKQKQWKKTIRQSEQNWVSAGYE